jgi:hypothetical protein
MRFKFDASETREAKADGISKVRFLVLSVAG